MKNDYAIIIEDIDKRYRLYDRPIDRLKESLHPFGKKYSHDFYALKKVSLNVKKGEIVGIIGRNGSGKSTLLKIITGIITATQGDVVVNGKVSALLELGTGFNPELTGLENIYFNGSINGYTRTEMEEKIPSIVEFADIGDFIHQPVKMYSSGMFVRLAFAVAISVEPEILIVDEALAVGDAQFQKKCLNFFYKLMETGCTILLVSHDAYTIRNFCQRVLYLYKGEVRAFGDSGTVVDQYTYDMERSETGGEASLATENAKIPVVDDNSGIPFVIDKVELLDHQDNPVKQVYTGQELQLRFHYRTIGKVENKISFVFNLYRHNDLYICGTTTLMDGLEPFAPQKKGRVTIRFPQLSLLSGNYKWRVAINDDGGMGIYTEAVPVCEFQVKDHFEAVGLVNLQREWQVE